MSADDLLAMKVEENFSDSDDENTKKESAIKENKRNAKADQKEMVKSKSAQVNFNVDLVIKMGSRPNQTEKIASAKRYFSKNKRPRNLIVSKLSEAKQVE